MTAGLRTGQVAEAARVNVQTLRYYERRGLLKEPDRTLGGHRVYPPETVAVLRVIKAAQRLGFTLNEVSDLIEAAPSRHAGPPDSRLPALAAAKLAEVEARLADLAVLRKTLRAALAAGCDDLAACATRDCCPIPFGELAAEREPRERLPDEAGYQVRGGLDGGQTAPGALTELRWNSR